LVAADGGAPHFAVARAGTRACPRGFAMIAPETFSHIENIKKRAGHLWRFL
jgi:hypothetical protein